MDVLTSVGLSMSMSICQCLHIYYLSIWSEDLMTCQRTLWHIRRHGNLSEDMMINQRIQWLIRWQTLWQIREYVDQWPEDMMINQRMHWLIRGQTLWPFRGHDDQSKDMLTNNQRTWCQSRDMMTNTWKVSAQLLLNLVSFLDKFSCIFLMIR